MKRKVLALLSICVLSFGLVACSNKENIQTEELPKKESQQEDTVSQKRGVGNIFDVIYEQERTD